MWVVTGHHDGTYLARCGFLPPDVHHTVPGGCVAVALRIIAPAQHVEGDTLPPVPIDQRRTAHRRWH